METISNDHDLIGRYVADESEEAFKELFRRHFSLVYGSARRITRDPDLACDVAQCVFHQFARKAGSITRDVHLAGWFHKAAVFEASKLVRSECRRRTREIEAGSLAEEPSATRLLGYDGVSLEQQLDLALAKLGKEDRNLVLLRFWHRMSARQMAKVLGLTESAAQKRLTRALGKLRTQVALGGLAPDITTIAGLLPVMLHEAAPASQATKVSYLLSATLLERKLSWTARMESAFFRILHAHRPAVAGALLALNTVIWAGVYQPVEPAAGPAPATASSLMLLNGWRNLGLGLAFVVDASFTKLGILPANTPGSSSGSCH